MPIPSSFSPMASRQHKNSNRDAHNGSRGTNHHHDVASAASSQKLSSQSLHVLYSSTSDHNSQHNLKKNNNAIVGDIVKSSMSSNIQETSAERRARIDRHHLPVGSMGVRRIDEGEEADDGDAAEDEAVVLGEGCDCSASKFGPSSSPASDAVSEASRPHSDSSSAAVAVVTPTPPASLARSEATRHNGTGLYKGFLPQHVVTLTTTYRPHAPAMKAPCAHGDASQNHDYYSKAADYHGTRAFAFAKNQRLAQYQRTRALEEAAAGERRREADGGQGDTQKEQHQAQDGGVNAIVVQTAAELGRAMVQSARGTSATIVRRRESASLLPMPPSSPTPHSARLPPSHGDNAHHAGLGGGGGGTNTFTRFSALSYDAAVDAPRGLDTALEAEYIAANTANGLPPQTFVHNMMLLRQSRLDELNKGSAAIAARRRQFASAMAGTLDRQLVMGLSAVGRGGMLGVSPSSPSIELGSEEGDRQGAQHAAPTPPSPRGGTSSSAAAADRASGASLPSISSSATTAAASQRLSVSGALRSYDDGDGATPTRPVTTNTAAMTLMLRTGEQLLLAPTAFEIRRLTQQQAPPIRSVKSVADRKKANTSILTSTRRIISPLEPSLGHASGPNNTHATNSNVHPSQQRRTAQKERTAQVNDVDRWRVRMGFAELSEVCSGAYQ